MSVKPIISAAEAAKFVQDGMTFTTSGFVACEMPESLSKLTTLHMKACSRESSAVTTTWSPSSAS